MSFNPRRENNSLPHIIAHRGISGKAPENTLAAFSRAVNTSGISGIELDVRLSKDAEVIVLHDRTLERTTTGNGSARSYDLRELKKLDAGSWFDPKFSNQRIPTLREVFELARGHSWVNIELKSDFLQREKPGFLEQRVVETVIECGMRDSVMYSSFNHKMVSKIKQIDPEAITGALYNLYYDFWKKPSRLAQDANADVFVCAKHELFPSMVSDAHNAGISVFVYTLNKSHIAERMIDLGVDGILSDNADDIAQAITMSSR